MTTRSPLTAGKLRSLVEALDAARANHEACRHNSSAAALHEAQRSLEVELRDHARGMLTILSALETLGETRSRAWEKRHQPHNAQVAAEDWDARCEAERIVDTLADALHIVATADADGA